MSQFMIVPQSKNSDEFLELARTPKTQGRLFRKHILSEGVLNYDGKKIQIDTAFLTSIVDNFNSKKCDIVQVPIVDKANRHSEDPLRNIGEVIDLKIENGKLYSFIDARKENAADELGKTLIGASAMISPDYVDTDSGEKVGPTLLHVAITNRPHVLNLDDFEEVIQASSNSSDEIILLSEDDVSENTDIEENQTMDLDTLIETLKTEHDIDVSALQAQVTELQTETATLTTEKDSLITENTELKEKVTTTEDLAVSLSNAVKEALTKDETLALSAGDGSNENIIAVITEAGVKLSAQEAEIVSLSGRIGSLETDKKHAAAEVVVDGLIREGKILPKNKEDFIELRLSNEEMFDKIIPENAIIDLSGESGQDLSFDSTSTDTVKGEVDRILAATK